MNRNKILVLMILVGLLFVNYVKADGPVSPVVADEGPDTTKTSFPAAKQINAEAGNITQLTVNATSVTQTWQGYFGNISGTIVLDNAANESMYDWDQATPTGEVYAVSSEIADWSDIVCFNFTSKTESNLTTIETALGVDYGDADGVDETFDGTTHAEFAVGAVTITLNTCPATKTYVSDGTSTDFQNVLLYDPSQDLPIYTGLIHQDTTGFDGEAHDFQLLVGENGHGNTDSTQYYFYVEIA